jgi:cytochrome P450
MARFSFVETGLTLLVLYLLKRLLFKKGKTSKPLPPGPKGLPVLGNINDLPPPGKPEFEHWLKHKDRYGSISSINVLGTTFIIMHDKSMVMELMEKRGSKHSGRPRMKFGMDMFVPCHESSYTTLTLARVGWINTIIGQQYDKGFRYG